MIELWRKSGDLYRCTTFQIPFGMVAEKERRLPAKWIAPRNNDTLQAFSAYAGLYLGHYRRTLAFWNNQGQQMSCYTQRQEGVLGFSAVESLASPVPLLRVRFST